MQFFEVTVSQEDAVALVDDYVSTNDFSFPSRTSNISSDVRFYGLALEGNSDNQDLVKVMNTDDCFRHFLLNTTNQTHPAPS